MPVMLSQFIANAHLVRFLVSPAKSTLSNVVTRSFMVYSRVASPKAAEAGTAKTKENKSKSKKGSESTKEKKGSGSTKPKKGSSRSKKAEKPKIVITDDMKPPKRATLPYIIFSQEYSSKLSKLNSMQEACDRAKECGAAWKALSSSEKEQYHEAYRRLHEEYKQRKDEWLKNVDPEVLKALNKKRIAAGKRKLTKLKPERPVNPYARFVSAFHQEQGTKNLPFIEVSRAASGAWRSLPDEEKKPYLDRFKQEMDEWRQRKAVDGGLKA